MGVFPAVQGKGWQSDAGRRWEVLEATGGAGGGCAPTWAGGVSPAPTTRSPRPLHAAAPPLTPRGL